MLYLNDHPIAPTIFPDKTSQVWKLPVELLQANTYTIRWEFDHEGEFMQLAQLNDLLLAQKPRRVRTLELTYLPYARQDKSVSNELTFALSPFVKLLNSLSFNWVTIIDPHSSVALDFIWGSRAVYPTAEVAQRFADMQGDVVCYPDKGALTKYSKIYDFPYIYGEKNRDQSTGYILGYEVIGNAKGLRVLIVDDLCDGGATFIFLAKALLEQGALEVNLFVTHGIFSKGVQVLKDAGITHVFTPAGEQ